MIELDLKLVLDEATESGLVVGGWYLPSNSLAEWIEALDGSCLRGRSHTDYRLFIAPTSVRDIRASGLLCLANRHVGELLRNSPSRSLGFQPGGSSGYQTRSSTNSQAGSLGYEDSQPSRGATRLQNDTSFEVPLGAIGLVGEHSRSGLVEVWMPFNARLEPNITLSQLAADVEDREPRCYVWLPSVGLTAFEALDAVSLTQLLRKPATAINAGNRKWSAFPDIGQLPDRIVDIVFPQPEPFEQLFQQEQNEIGGDSSQLSNIDDQGNTDRQGILSKLRDATSRQVEKWIKDRNKHQRQQAEEARASGKPVKGSIGQNLTGRLLNQMSKAIQSQRDKQLDKLLKLMQTDPDKALRFAIPLAAMSAFRGLAQANNFLSDRTPDFSLSKLFGSGPVDPWAFDEKMRNQLQAAYRMQAERELAIGRFRRAAYLYAHLLGDLTAAATVLEHGKAFREAAVLYGDKLKRPRDQARCLALDGQSNQAARIYEELGDFEAAAKVWEDFADEERARLAYIKAVEQKIANHQILAASQLLDEKISDRPRAEALLWDQWPNGQQALSCAELGFRWFAESGKHELAREKFETLVQRTDSYNRLLLAKLSAGLARRCPDPELRAIAEDRCRVVAGAGLRDVTEKEMIERLGLIRSLQSDDVLLRRDTTRFEEIEKSQGLALQPVAAAGRPKLNPLPSLRLPELGEYFYGEVLDGEFFAMARDSRKLLGVRAAMLDDLQKLLKTYVPILEMDLVQFLKVSCIHNRSAQAREILLSFEGLTMEGWAARELHPPIHGRPWKIVHNPLAVSENSELCGGFGEDGFRWSVSGNPFVLYGYSSSSLITQELPSPTVDIVVESLDQVQSKPNDCKMLVVGNSPIIAVGELLVRYTQGAIEEICDLGGTPNSMAASLPHTAPRIAIATDQSLKIVWLDRGNRVETISEYEQFTHVCFVHGGRMLAATEKYLYLYNIYQGKSRTVLRLARQLLQSQKVIALMSITAEVVGVLYENGVIERYRVK